MQNQQKKEKKRFDTCLIFPCTGKTEEKAKKKVRITGPSTQITRSGQGTSEEKFFSKKNPRNFS
jgi:hypothetical protein